MTTLAEVASGARSLAVDCGETVKDFETIAAALNAQGMQRIERMRGAIEALDMARGQLEDAASAKQAAHEAAMEYSGAHGDDVPQSLRFAAGE